MVLKEFQKKRLMRAPGRFQGFSRVIETFEEGSEGFEPCSSLKCL